MATSYTVYAGCYTLPSQADPFAQPSLGGVPHDRSVVGRGVRTLTLSPDGTLSPDDDDDDGDEKAGAGGSESSVAEELTNPSYLCLWPEGSGPETGGGFESSPRWMYAVSEVEREEDAVVAAFALPTAENAKGGTKKKTGGDNSLELIGKYATRGAVPAHVSAFSRSYDGKTQHHHVLVSNYGTDNEGLRSSSVSIYDANAEDGSLTLADTVRLDPRGSGVNEMRQRSSHAHCAIPRRVPKTGEKDEWYVYVTDLGADLVLTYRIDVVDSSESSSSFPNTTTTTKTRLVELSRYSVPPGSGPRSLSLHPSLDLAAVTLEMAGEVLLLRLRPDGSVELAGRREALVPEDWPDTSMEEGRRMAKYNGGRWASDVVWSPCGTFLYAAARLHDSLSAFRLECREDDDDDDVADESRESSKPRPALTLIQRVPSRGVTPRTLCPTPDGRYLLVAHQHSHSVCSFRIDGKTGELDFVDEARVPLASCVKVVEKQSTDVA